LTLRTLYIATLAVAVSGCAHVFPATVVAHGSDPSRGQPFNHDCDPTMDFAGSGIGYVHKNNRVYVTIGQKLVRQCPLGARPHIDDKSLGGLAIYIHEFKRE
jgi:hypothetical protein